MCIVLLKHWLTNNMKKLKCLRKNTTYILVWSCAINIWYPHQHMCYAAFYLFFILLYTAGTALNFVVLVTMTITIFWFWKCIKTNEHGFVYSLALACSPPPLFEPHIPWQEINTIKYVFEEKFSQITSESFYSEEQLVKFHSFRLQWVAITACNSSSNTQHLMHILQKCIHNMTTCV